MLIYKWKELSSKARRDGSIQTFGMTDDIMGLAGPWRGNDKKGKGEKWIIVKKR